MARAQGAPPVHSNERPGLRSFVANGALRHNLRSPSESRPPRKAAATKTCCGSSVYPQHNHTNNCHPEERISRRRISTLASCLAPRDRAPSIRRSKLLHFRPPLHIPPPNREILMPARSTAIRGNLQPPPQKRKVRIHKLRRNPLQVLIPANRAMRPHRIAQRHFSPVKTRVAFLATPWINTHHAQNVVWDILTSRASRVGTFTDRAGHLFTSMSSVSPSD